MWNLVWLDSALNDIVRLRLFIAKENLQAAQKAASAIQEAAELLIQTPSIGKPIKNLPEYRDLFIPFGAAGYILRYRLYLQSIYVVHVRHYREEDFRNQQKVSLNALQDKTKKTDKKYTVDDFVADRRLEAKKEREE